MLQRRFFWAAVLAACVLTANTGSAVAADKPVINVAHIRLSGSLGEEPAATDSLFGAGSENFKHKLDRIKKAKDDKNIQALYLELESVHIGWGRLNELRHAIHEFRTAGKKAYAYLESGESKDYLLAIACDEVCLPESGWLMLTGMELETTFYKDLLDKLGLKADVLKMGAYKGAVEPFIRTSLSPEVRKNLESVLDDLYEKSYVRRIIKSRPAQKFTVEQVKKIVDEGPYTAKKAKELGLVDRVAYAEGFRAMLKTALDAEKINVVRNYGKPKSEKTDLSNPFTLLKKLMAEPETKTSNKPKIAVIYAVGPITTGKGGEGLFGGSIVGSTTTIQAIRKAEKDETVKAIVLRVDSPGGSALASDLIWAELKRCKKPIVASMGDVAASGGYYISMGAGKIYAEPGTLTGSIGVFGMKLVTAGLEDKVGLKTETIKRGSNAGLMSTNTAFSASERKAMAALIEDVYDQFLTKALEGRTKAGKKLTREQLISLAGGRIWTGRQAKENGLVDELGTLDEAIAAAKEMSGNKGADMELLILPKPKSFLESLVEKSADEQLSLSAGTTAAARLLLREMPELARRVRPLEGLLRSHRERLWLAMPYAIEVK